MKPYRLKYLISLLGIILLISGAGCEKIVTVELDKTDPQLVIEGVVSDRNDSSFVKLTKSGNYFDPSLYFPPVSKALVVITNDRGTIDTLLETTPGVYRSASLRGMPQSTYTLSLQSDGRSYSAVTTMPEKVVIDSLFTEKQISFGGRIGYYVNVKFRDPPAQGNYYRMNFYIGALAADSVLGLRYNLYRDKLATGNEVTYRMRLRRTTNPGDTVTVTMYSIDKAMYDYYNTLNNIITYRGPTSMSPANPNTNLSAGLGYFGAYALDTKSVVLR
jgi:hypothetical protein